MNQKQKARRNKALRHSKPASTETLIASGLGEKVAEGLTFGKHAFAEANERFPAVNIDGAKQVAHMHTADKELEKRRYAQFVASNNTDAVWTDGVTDRVQMDYIVTYTKEGFRFLQEGRQCLRCQEPHPDEPFPLECDMCGYAMKERQIMDIAMEFDGLRHIGPSKGIRQYQEELEEKAERRRFEERKGGGHSVRVRKKIYSPGARDAKFGAGGPKREIVLPPGVNAT